MRLPLVLPALLISLVAVAVLSLTEIAASLLVCPAGTKSLSITLLNMIHFGRNDEVIAMVLYLMGFVGLLAALGVWVAGGFRRFAQRR